MKGIDFGSADTVVNVATVELRFGDVVLAECIIIAELVALLFGDFSSNSAIRTHVLDSYWSTNTLLIPRGFQLL